MRHTFAIDVERCNSCGEKMKLLSVVTDPEAIARFLHYLAEPTEPEPLPPPRGPPYYKSRVLRRRSGDDATIDDAFAA
jgi:hypothetical protein